MNQPSSGHYDRVIQLLAFGVVAAVAVIGLSLNHQAGRPWLPLAGLLLAFALLLTRTPQRGAPVWRMHLYLGLQTALVAATMLLSQGPTIFATLYFVLSAETMLLLPKRPGLAWIGAFGLITAAILLASEGWPTGLLGAPMYVGGYFFFGIFSLSVADAEAARRKSQALADDLQAANSQLQDYAARIEELAVVEERSRLAREMHDTLGHCLTVAAVQLEGAQRLIATDPDRAASMIGTVREQVREALVGLRQTVAALRVPLEADLSLAHSLARLATTFEQATGLTVHQVLPEELPSLPSAHRLAIYRAAQEALTNIQRHAGASQAWLVLSVRDRSITLLVSDDGRGLSLSAEQPGYGLSGLRERAAQLGGEFHVEPRRGGGTELSFRLPIGADQGLGIASVPDP